MLPVVLLFLNVDVFAVVFVVEMNLQLDQFEHAASLPPLSHYHNIDSRLLIFVPVSTVSSLTYFYLPILAHYIHPALVALSLPDMNRSCCLYLSACLFFYGNVIIFAIITNKKKRVYINIESTECNNLQYVFMLIIIHSMQNVLYKGMLHYTLAFSLHIIFRDV